MSASGDIDLCLNYVAISSGMTTMASKLCNEVCSLKTHYMLPMKSRQETPHL